MKRKNYRERKQILFSIEKEDFDAFHLLCERERKSLSLKLAEIIEEELQKNELGRENPIGIDFTRTNKYVENVYTLDDYVYQAEVANTPIELNNLRSVYKRYDNKVEILIRTVVKRESDLGIKRHERLFYRR